MSTSWPLVGRVKELAACLRALEDPDTCGVVLVGAPGVGKTRLAREALATVEAAGYAPWWVVASRAAASITFGAVAHLIPPVHDGGTDRFTVLQRAGEWLTASTPGRRPVLGIDDAHWLDDGSAALIHHLSMTGVASVVVTVRSGEPAPDPVTALWKDGLAERVEVGKLSRAETIELIEAGLGGPVDGLTVERLWQLTEGNALYLRELIRGGVDTGALVYSDRLWRWRGSLRAPQRPIELLECRIGKAPLSVQALHELVAFGEPLDVDTLRRVGVEQATVVATEAAGLVCSEAVGSRIQLRLAHPLYGEALRARTSPLRTRAVYAMLTRTLSESGTIQPGDGLRFAVWHLNAGMSCEPDLLMAGATTALVGLDYPLAERLAQSALTEGGGLAAQQALARALVGQGRGEQAEQILGGLSLEGMSDPARATVAHIRALNLHWGLGRPSEADAVLNSAEAAITDPACRDQLVCLRAKFLQYTGWCSDAANLATKVLARPNATDAAVSDSMVVLSQCLTALGRYDQAITTGKRAAEFERRRNDGSWSFPEDEVLAASGIGYVWGGQLAEAEALITPRYRRSVAICWPLGAALWAVWLGETSRSRGQLTAALRWCREAAMRARRDDFRHPYWSFIAYLVLGCYARTAAQAGEAAEAQAALAEAEALAGPSTAVMDSFFGPIHAWVVAAHGEITAAVELALKAADVERHRGNAGFEIIALHDLVRFGAPAQAVERLAELATIVEGRLAPLYAAHGAALAAADGAALDAVAAGFAELGYLLLAAEAATQATTAHRAVGYRSRANASAVRARALAARCDGARTPALTVLDPAVGLTRRETEIARLAATGLSSRVIAERLVVAVRTVDNALGAAYAKLGIRGRDGLAAALAAAATVDSE